MRKKICALMLIVVLCSTSVFSEVMAADRILTLEEIRTLAIENSTGVQNTKIDLVKKQIELR